MTFVVAVVLLALALLDGAFSGFRSSVGRSGLVEHRAADYRANRRGVALMTALLLPGVLLISIAVAVDRDRLGQFSRAGRSLLAVYLPYAAVVLTALAVYGLLGWRRRYLASAVILGPLTLARPVVVLAGFVLVVIRSREPVVVLSALLVTVAVLAGEPLADRIWYGRGDSTAESGQAVRATPV